MSVWQAVENEIVQTLSGLTASARPILATVRGQTARDRKVLVASLLRERMPAACVTLTGRDDGDKEYGRPGAVQVSVLYASRSERGDDEARHGGVDVQGVMAVAEAAAIRLQDLDLGDSRRLVLMDERSVAGEPNTALWEQRYAVHRQAGEHTPTFGGYALVGPSSEVEVRVGELKRVASTFAFPGVDGVFERFAGMRERPITWSGQLRAADHAGLNQIEAGIEQIICSAAPDVLSDPWARTFRHCVAKSFKRVGPRGRDDLTGEALQAFELDFIQLAQ